MFFSAEVLEVFYLKIEEQIPVKFPYFIFILSKRN